MFDIGINTLVHSSCHCTGPYHSCQYSVLRKIFIISCSKRSSVGIHPRCIPTMGPHLPAHLTHAAAPFTCQLLIPCGSNYYFNRESDGANPGKVVVDSSRSIKIQCANFAYRFNGRCLISGHGNHSCHLIHGQLVQQCFPAWIIIISAPHVGQLHSILCPGDRHGITAV